MYVIQTFRIPKHTNCADIFPFKIHNAILWRVTCQTQPNYSDFFFFKICIQTKKPISSSALSNSLNILIVSSLSFDCWNFVFDLPFQIQMKGFFEIFHAVCHFGSLVYNTLYIVQHTTSIVRMQEVKKVRFFLFVFLSLSLSVSFCVFVKLQ